MNDSTKTPNSFVVKLKIKLALLILSGLFIAGCVPSNPSPPAPEPTPTPFSIMVDGQVIILVPGENILPEIYEAAKSPEILENNDWVFVDGHWDLMTKGVSTPLEVEEPRLDEPVPPLYPGFPQKWQTFHMPTLGLEVDYPLDWHLETLEKGIRMESVDGSTWASVESYPNPAQTSLKVWLAESGPVLPGEVTAESEVYILGEPAFLQQVSRPKTERDPAGEYLSLWMASGEWVYLWTAWPGEQAETYDFLMYAAATLR